MWISKGRSVREGMISVCVLRVGDSASFYTSKSYQAAKFKFEFAASQEGTMTCAQVLGYLRMTRAPRPSTSLCTFVSGSSMFDILISFLPGGESGSFISLIF
jgi:hypothetical protein